MADHAVSEFIYIYDPDFNGIEVYRDKSPSEWKWKDHTVYMVTEPLDVQDLLKESIAGDNEWNELPPNTTIGHVHLHVSNLAPAKEFYHEILDLNNTAIFLVHISLLQIDIIIMLLRIHGLEKIFLMQLMIIVNQGLIIMG